MEEERTNRVGQAPTHCFKSGSVRADVFENQVTKKDGSTFISHNVQFYRWIKSGNDFKALKSFNNMHLADVEVLSREVRKVLNYQKTK